MLFRSALFPSKNAPTATATITIATIPVAISSAESEEDSFASAWDGEDEDDELGDLLNVGVDFDGVVGDVLGGCVEIGAGIGAFGFGIASGFGVVKKGTKSTVPKLKSFLLSYNVWFIACVSVVPHQL